MAVNNIVLIGFMGAGKSTVARELRRLRGMDILEMDARIAEDAGMSIPEIFRTRGEQAFRDMETELLQRLRSGENTVVSCGGGTPMREVNVEKMRAIGPVILLWASPETVLERVREDHGRPLLEGHKDTAYIAQLLEQRRAKYEAAADHIVVTDGKSVTEICREILALTEGGN